MASPWYNLFVLMPSFFNRQRFGEPQFIAGLLLLVFLMQCAWLVRRDLRSGNLSSSERFVIERGLEQWRPMHRQSSVIAPVPDHDQNTGIPDLMSDTPGSDVYGFAGVWDPNHSSLYYLVSAAPLLVWPGALANDSVAFWGWLARAPGMLFGLFLGASVWYVGRRLYGNPGGYVALVLFCFSPGLIRASAGWFAQPEMGAAWAAFGAIFTGIAVAHTLYAPREVVLWNWRRILLLGVALAMGIGSQFSLLILIPLVLGFLLYLAPERRKAALAIWAAACVTATLLLLATYFFRISAFWNGLRHAMFLPVTGSAFLMIRAYSYLIRQIVESCPALVIAFPTALVVFVVWRRARYFGNAAPLLVGSVFIALGLGMPHYPGMGFRLIAVPFLLLFVAGIAADVLETRYREVVLPVVAGLLASYALWSLLELAHVRA